MMSYNKNRLQLFPVDIKNKGDNHRDHRNYRDQKQHHHQHQHQHQQHHSCYTPLEILAMTATSAVECSHRSHSSLLLSSANNDNDNNSRYVTTMNEMRKVDTVDEVVSSQYNYNVLDNNNTTNANTNEHSSSSSSSPRCESKQKQKKYPISLYYKKQKQSAYRVSQNDDMYQIHRQEMVISLALPSSSNNCMMPLLPSSPMNERRGSSILMTTTNETTSTSPTTESICITNQPYTNNETNTLNVTTSTDNKVVHVNNKASEFSRDKQKSIVDACLEKYGAMYYSDIIITDEDVNNDSSSEESNSLPNSMSKSKKTKQIQKEDCSLKERKEVFYKVIVQLLNEFCIGQETIISSIYDFYHLKLKKKSRGLFKTQQSRKSIREDILAILSTTKRNIARSVKEKGAVEEENHNEKKKRKRTAATETKKDNWSASIAMQYHMNISKIINSNSNHNNQMMTTPRHNAMNSTASAKTTYNDTTMMMPRHHINNTTSIMMYPSPPRRLSNSNSNSSNSNDTIIASLLLLAEQQQQRQWQERERFELIMLLAAASNTMY
jgi:hypothetical protein